MAQVSGKAFDAQILRGVLRYAKPYRKTFALAGALTVVLGLLSTARPLLIRDAVDAAVAAESAGDVHRILLVLFGLLLVEGLLQWSFYRMTNRLGQWVIRDLRVQLFDRLLRFKMSYFDRTPVGTLVTRTVSDAETIADIFAEGLLVIFGDFCGHPLVSKIHSIQLHGRPEPSSCPERLRARANHGNGAGAPFWARKSRSRPF
jgi:ATP-binding cassette, subfamily B, multidrug efflux pump